MGGEARHWKWVPQERGPKPLPPRAFMENERTQTLHVLPHLVLPTAPSGRCWHQRIRFAHRKTELRGAKLCALGVGPGFSSSCGRGSHALPFLAPSVMQEEESTLLPYIGGGVGVRGQ